MAADRRLGEAGEEEVRLANGYDAGAFLSKSSTSA
jgi:hypothetical protein